jgi:predicted AAA+ superfamily ATPase
MVKTLLEYCKPRGSVFDEAKRDNVLDLTDLIENNIDPVRFFDENFPTQGMKSLMDTAFKRFHR